MFLTCLARSERSKEDELDWEGGWEPEGGGLVGIDWVPRSQGGRARSADVRGFEGVAIVDPTQSQSPEAVALHCGLGPAAPGAVRL